MRIFPFGAVPVLVCAVLLTSAAGATPKVHVITFGKWTSVQSVRDSGTDDKPLILVLKIRALSIDGRVKEYALGAPHEVTERLFVVRRAFRMNDSLPDDPGPRWQWQRGGWLLVDRLTGRVSPSIFLSSIFHIPPPPGTATTLHIVALRTTERRHSPSSPN